MPWKLPDLATVMLGASLLACGGVSPGPPSEEDDAGGAGRGTEVQAEVQALTDNTRWSPLDAAEDGFRETLSAAPRVCADTEWGIEAPFGAGSGAGAGQDADVLFELHTDVCNYLTVTQPTLARIREGDSVRAHAWHTQVVSPDGATQAHLALAIGGRTIWREAIALPSRAARSFEVRWEADRDVPEGTAVWFHVDNHGQNTWKLTTLSRHATTGTPR